MYGASYNVSRDCRADSLSTRHLRMPLAIEEDGLRDHLDHPGGQRHEQSGRWHWGPGRLGFRAGGFVSFNKWIHYCTPVSKFSSLQQGCGLGDSSDTF